MSTSQCERQRNKPRRKPAYRADQGNLGGEQLSYEKLRARIGGAHCSAVRERKSGDIIVNLEYCGQSVASLLEAANFFSRLANKLSARRVAARS